MSELPPDPLAGWPKKLPCLRCGRLRTAQRPTLRLCRDCRVARADDVGAIAESSLPIPYRPECGAPGFVDTHVRIMNARGRVLRVVNAETAEVVGPREQARRYYENRARRVKR